MHSHSPLKYMRHILKKQGLSKSYIDQVLGELRDHLQDRHVTNLAEFHQIIGDPVQLSSMYTQNYRQATITGKRPLLMLLLGGFALTSWSWFLFHYIWVHFSEQFLIWMYHGRIENLSIEQLPFWQTYFLLLLHSLGDWLPFLFSGMILLTLAYQSGRGIYAYILACTFPLLLSLICHSTLDIKYDDLSKSDLSIYMGEQINHLGLATFLCGLCFYLYTKYILKTTLPQLLNPNDDLTQSIYWADL